MADHFSQNFKQSFSLEDIDPCFEFMNQFSGLNPVHQDTSGLNFLIDSFSPQLSFPGLFIHEDNSVMPCITDPIISINENDQKNRKRKAMDVNTPESSSANSSIYSSHQSSDNGIGKTNCGRGKKVKSNEKENEKPRDVVHVRAKRGQATDSHSLAERARRGKINERLRCLQDIVPGCYKTMGMAVMLDEIINYVQSLQNQVEFLSMKLTAASTFHDFNPDIDVVETMQRAKASEALKVQNVTSPQFGQLGLNFGCYPQLPHSR